MKAPLILGIGALAAGAAFLASRKAAAETETEADASGGTGVTPGGQPLPVTPENIARPAAGDSVSERMANAISRGPEAMRATAGALRDEGLSAAADELLRQIDVRSAGLPPIVDEETGRTAPAPVSVQDSPAKLRAQALTVSLRMAGPTRGDPRVRAYQGEEGLTIDGLYGPDTASAVARAGVVPYPPQVFARDATRRRASIAAYRDLINRQERKLGGDWSPALRGVPAV